MISVDAHIRNLEHSLLRLCSITGDGPLTDVVRRLSRGAWSTLHHGRHPLSKGHRTRAVFNLWAWQAWRRVLKQPLLVELQTGAKILCPTWSALAGSWVSIGVHEAELFFTADVVREHDTFLDVGANVGVYAVTAARRGARVVAFEPTESARQTIVQNAALNGVSERIVASQFALSDYDGSAYFTVGAEVGNHLVEDRSQGQPVEVRKLDSCLHELLGRTLTVDCAGPPRRSRRIVPH